MTELPTGTMTFLLTDVVGSTTLWDRAEQSMEHALERHDSIVTSCIDEHRGVAVRSRSEGDSFFAVFSQATDALRAACSIQQELYAEAWPEDAPIRIRIGLHTGEAQLRDCNYFGHDVNRCSRLRSLAHGGQILLSATTAGIVEGRCPAGVTLRDLGEHWLRGLTRPERVLEVIHPDLPSEFPPLADAILPQSRLTAQPTRLLGRTRELEVAREILLGHDARLLTLTGPGGIGKTRLAERIVDDLAGSFEDGACSVTLASITERSLVIPTIAQALGLTGIQENAEQPLEETLYGTLRDRELLLLLDNFERVASSARIVASLLEHCPRLKVLVTSRLVLHIYGEHVLAVPPLALPGPTSTEPAELEASEAVQLFVERARAARANFSVDAETLAAIAALCRRLDGLPLAIELAAACVQFMHPATILTRFQRALSLPPSRTINGPSRHRTMRSAIDWSFGLLDTREQILFRRLAQFVDGATLEAIDAVCNADADLGCDMEQALISLLDKSMLTMKETSRYDPRFTMLEALREYGMEQLVASGEAETIRQRHAQYVVDLAEQAEIGLCGPDQADWLERLDGEFNNVRAALTWALADGDLEIGLRLAGAIWRFWAIRGNMREGQRWLDALLARAPRDAAARTQALNASGYLTFMQGNYADAWARHEEALTLARATQNRRGIVTALSIMGLIARVRGDYVQAAACSREAIQTGAGRDGNPWYILATNTLGRIAFYEGRHCEARRFHQDALERFRRAGDCWEVAHTLSNLSHIAQAAGNYAEARVHLEEAVALYHELGDRQGAVDCLEGLAASLREPVRAVELIATTTTIRRSLGGPGSPSRRRKLNEILDAARGQLADAGYEAAWERGRSVPLEGAIAQALEQSHRLAEPPGEPTAGHLPPPPPPTVNGTQDSDERADAGPLTAREVAVAICIAAGLTNRQIATELVVSERTIDTHVSHILHKLDLANRAQVATWVSQRGLR